jgi:hypothetical protein
VTPLVSIVGRAMVGRSAVFLKCQRPPEDREATTIAMIY